MAMRTSRAVLLGLCAAALLACERKPDAKNDTPSIGSAAASGKNALDIAITLPLENKGKITGGSVGSNTPAPPPPPRPQ